MKQIIFLLTSVLAFFSFAVQAQTATVTLEHGDELSVFHGTEAFVNAMENAQDGDVIYLSAGRYSPTDILKSVTIIGSGIVDDKSKGLYSTSLDASLSVTLNIELTDGSGLKISGVRFPSYTNLKSDLDSSLFSDCYFYYLSLRQTTDNLTFKDCRIDYALELSKHQNNLLFLNSYIYACQDYSNGSSTIYFKNCVINNFGQKDFYQPKRIKSATIENSITVKSASQEPNIKWIRSIINSNYKIDDSQKIGCFTLNDSQIANLWGDGFMRLTDEAAAKYIGSDGTQIGMYGGSIPYTEAVSGLRITKMEVPAESDENGNITITLSVSGDE